MSYATWHWVFGRKPHRQFTLPYIAQSPTTKQKREFSTIDDIWKEILLIEESDKFSLGQQLFYLIPLFANADYVITSEDVQLINAYHYITDYHIPLGTTLDDTDAQKLVMFNIIKNEMAIALKHRQEKYGHSKS